MKPIYVNMNLSVKTVLDQIKEALDDAQTMKATKLLIYYCGHGHPDYGGWVTYPSE